jgi:GntR family transcriptional regulator
MLAVSRITVRHALRNLEEYGLLKREHGRGTFVRSATVVAGTRRLTSFTEEMANLRLNAGSPLLSASVGPASAAVAAALEIEEGASVVCIRRLRLGDNVPIGLQSAHFSVERVPGFLDGAPLEGSLYAALKAHYGIVPDEAHEVYRVGLVGEADAELLDVPAGSPAFVIERVAFDPRGPLEFTLSIMRGDRYEIRSMLRI